MAAAVGHLGHNTSTNVVGWLEVMIYVGIRRDSYQAIGNTIPKR
jgi:hypothetical protein